MIIGIASGKGGTGKTTLSLNLARSIDRRVQLLDCDVEEPNSHLFLQGEVLERTPVTIPVPEVNEDLCDGCGECGRFCEYNAIVCPGKTAMVFESLCHGCGGCARVCPQNAITEKEKRIGVIEKRISGKITLVHGLLDVGVPMAPPLVRAVKKREYENTPVIIDAPPGTSCPVITALRGVDFVILITEPTPFGLNDLALAVDVVREMKIPFGVVINRVGCGDNRVHEFCQKEGISILQEIPDDRRIAEAYSRGELMINTLPEYRPLFQELWDKIYGIMKNGKAD